MSLFNRRWLLVGILPLMSCGFEPIYGTNKPADLIMGKIDVEVSNGRNAFEFRERLIESLGALDGTPNYLLKYKCENILARILRKIVRLSSPHILFLC